MKKSIKNHSKVGCKKNKAVEYARKLRLENERYSVDITIVLGFRHPVI